MASETVDQIDWSHPSPSWAVPPGPPVHIVNQCGSATAGIRSCNLQHARQLPCLCGHSGHNINISIIILVFNSGPLHLQELSPKYMVGPAGIAFCISIRFFYYSERRLAVAAEMHLHVLFHLSSFNLIVSARMTSILHKSERQLFHCNCRTITNRTRFSPR